MAAKDMLSTKDGTCTFDHCAMRIAESNEPVLSVPYSCMPPRIDQLLVTLRTFELDASETNVQSTLECNRPAVNNLSLESGPKAAQKPKARRSCRRYTFEQN